MNGRAQRRFQAILDNYKFVEAPKGEGNSHVHYISDAFSTSVHLFAIPKYVRGQIRTTDFAKDYNGFGSLKRILNDLTVHSILES